MYSIQAKSVKILHKKVILFIKQKNRSKIWQRPVWSLHNTFFCEFFCISHWQVVEQIFFAFFLSFFNFMTHFVVLGFIWLYICVINTYIVIVSSFIFIWLTFKLLYNINSSLSLAILYKYKSTVKIFHGLSEE